MVQAELEALRTAFEHDKANHQRTSRAPLAKANPDGSAATTADNVATSTSEADPIVLQAKIESLERELALTRVEASEARQAHQAALLTAGVNARHEHQGTRAATSPARAVSIQANDGANRTGNSDRVGMGGDEINERCRVDSASPDTSPEPHALCYP